MIISKQNLIPLRSFIYSVIKKYIDTNVPKNSNKLDNNTPMDRTKPLYYDFDFLCPIMNSFHTNYNELIMKNYNNPLNNIAFPSYLPKNIYHTHGPNQKPCRINKRH